MDVLSQKHRIFVEAYAGDTVQAMQVAGYTGDIVKLERQGIALLQNPNVMEAIKQRSRYLKQTNKIVANREERQSFLSSIMRNQDPHRMVEFDDFDKPKKAEPIPMNTRLKALELLGKSEGDFTENINVQGSITVTDIISKSYQIPDDDLDAIEAEYEELREEKEAAETQSKTEENNNTNSDSGERRDDILVEGPEGRGLSDSLSGLI